MIGWFYVGYDFLNRVHGYFKIGESGKEYLSTRLSQIRQGDAFECLGFLKLFDVTDAERWFIESTVRLAMERAGFTHTQKDHFLYAIEKGRKVEQAHEIATQALDFAEAACTLIGVKYERGYKQYKRR